MAKTRLNTEDAFKSIMGKPATVPEQVTQENQIIKEEIKKDTKEYPIEAQKAKLVQTAFYITKNQQKALKIKAALGGTPNDKDQSSIVRAALNAYLEDVLKTLV